MSAVFMFLSLGERPGGRLKQTAFFLLHTERLLFDFAKAIDHRRPQQPDDVAFEWAEPAEVAERTHPERSFSRHDCFTPGAVLPGLRWLQSLVVSQDRDTRRIWDTMRRQLNGHPALVPGRFERLIDRDIQGLIAFCEDAASRGDFVVAIRVP